MAALDILARRDSIVSPGVSLALGVPVSRRLFGTDSREFLGVVVEVTEDRKAVWVHRFNDSPDASVWYAVAELETATQAELAEVARIMLRWQYRAILELKATYGRNA